MFHQMVKHQSGEHQGVAVYVGNQATQETNVQENELSS